MDKIFDAIVIGGGQSGLACGYYLKRAKLKFLILDKQQVSGGAWLNAWDSLTLFSPADYSSLPGWIMPKSDNKFVQYHKLKEFIDKNEFCNSCLIWLNRTKSSIKVFEDTLVLVTKNLAFR